MLTSEKLSNSNKEPSANYADISNWFLTHTYGASYLPEDGFLFPGGEKGSNLLSSYVDNAYNFFINDDSCVYFTFGSRVPSTELNRFQEAKCVFIIPFKLIFNQIISVSFSECIALGPVQLREGAAIVLQEGIIVPDYYKKNNIPIFYFKKAEERDSAVNQVIKFLNGITTSIKYSENMMFTPFADVFRINSSKKEENVNPNDFFNILEELQPALSRGHDFVSYSGYKDRLYIIKHFNLPSMENHLFYLFSLNYHTKKVLNWLNEFKDFSKESKDYLFEKIYRIYASWTILGKKSCKDTNEIPSLQIILSEEIEKSYQENPKDLQKFFESIIDNEQALNLNDDALLHDFYSCFLMNAYAI